jgi:hypothetical protein
MVLTETLSRNRAILAQFHATQVVESRAFQARIGRIRAEALVALQRTTTQAVEIDFDLEIARLLAPRKFTIL